MTDRDNSLSFDDLPGQNSSSLNFDDLPGGPSPVDVSRIISQFAKGATPVATGATVGHMGGGPYGSVLGGLTLPLADSLSGLYNYGARSLGFPNAQITPTSQFIRQLMEKTPSYDKARNQPERMAEVAGEAAGITTPQVKAAQMLGNKFFSTAPKTQIAAAPRSAAVGQKVGEDTKNPMAGLTASILTGTVVGRAGGPRKTKAVDVDNLRKQADILYKRAKDAGVVLNSQFVYKLHFKLSETIRSLGFDPDLHPGLNSVIKRLENTKGSMSLEALERTRRVLQNARGSRNYDEGRIAGEAMSELDKAVAAITKGNLVSGKTSGMKALVAARDVWARKSKAEIIEEMVENAQIRGAAKFTQSGLENAIRDQFRTLATNKKRLRQFNKSEQAMIKQIAKGGPGINMLRFVGKFAPKGAISTVLSVGAGTYLGGPIGGVAVPAAGFASQNAAARINMDRIMRLQQQMATGKRPPSRYANVPVSAARGAMSNPDLGLLSPRAAEYYR